ncbi:hypothetical protein Tco_0778886 [Tanacetum coccineum]
MADDQPMWENNQAVAPTHRAAIVAVDLRDNFTVKGHHLSMIKDRQFEGHPRADPHKHIAEFVEVCGMFCYGNTNADAIKLKLFPSSIAGEAKIWFNKLSPGVITTWEKMRQDLHKFNDDTLQSVWDTLHDMANNLRMRHQRDLPRDIPLDRIEVLRYDTKGVKVRKGKMQTKTKLTLEQTQQGVSDEVLNFKKYDYSSFQDKEKYEHVGLNVTSSQEGKRSQDDDKRLDSANGLKEAQDYTSQAKGTNSSLKSKDHYTYHKIKIKKSKTTSMIEDIFRM